MEIKHMLTSKPFATISYNTKMFLVNKLNELLLKQEIDYYMFIEHIAEEDEKKKHKHLYIVPSTRCDTNVLLSHLEEKVKRMAKPLRCMPAVSSKFGDWYMYAIHDRQYLLSKGQKRLHSYSKEDIVCSNKEFLEDCIHRIDKSKFVGNERLVNAVENDVPFEQLVVNGFVPVQLIMQYQQMYNILRTAVPVCRNGRESHTPKDKPILCNPDTGEVIDSRQTQSNVQDKDVIFETFDYQQQGLYDNEED